MVENPPANVGDIRDPGSIPGLGRSSEGGLGDPLQYFCLENLMNRGTRKATVPRIAQSQTQLKQLSQTSKLDVTLLIFYKGKLRFRKFRELHPSFPAKKKKSRIRIQI